jgi:hypothetical protein
MSESLLNEASRIRLTKLLREFFADTGCTQEFLLLARGETETSMLVHICLDGTKPRFNWIVAELKADSPADAFDVKFKDTIKGKTK